MGLHLSRKVRNRSIILVVVKYVLRFKSKPNIRFVDLKKCTKYNMRSRVQKNSLGLKISMGLKRLSAILINYIITCPVNAGAHWGWKGLWFRNASMGLTKEMLDTKKKLTKAKNFPCKKSVFVSFSSAETFVFVAEFLKYIWNAWLK